MELLDSQSILIAGYYQIKIGIVIPARLESKRLPEKVFIEFLGKTMLEHVWRRAVFSLPEIETVVVTANHQIIELCNKIGAKWIQTSENHENGLSRIGEAARHLNWDFYIVLQADEILIDPENIKYLYNFIIKNSYEPFYNLVVPLNSPKDLKDKNVVKCVINLKGYIMYIFRRNPLISKEPEELESIKKICGLFAISSQTLELFSKTIAQTLASFESIEQLKILELGDQLISLQVKNNYPSVNTKRDLRKVRTILSKDRYQINLLRLIFSENKKIFNS